MAEKILIADDDADVCNLTKYTLETSGYETFVCSNGRDVIANVKKESPQALVLDVMLPGIDGYSIVKKMSEDDAMKKIPVVIISSLEPSKNLFKPFNQVIKFLSKPFNPEDLVEEIQKGIKESKEWE